MDLGSTSAPDAVIKPRFYGDSTDAEVAPELAPAKGDVMVP
jgi:hypothetical protein